ncbi:MAG: bifunctional phosphoglucose/phosphomannose isomerase [Thermoleophilaceae bacterium]|nr:bifunctional phosphoglucose/phosphomannose isomerase [Thermoleophilaceae bacterium]
MSGADRLSADAIAAADPQGMVGDILDQPAQLTDALWRVESAGVAQRDAPGGLFICGMGGSAIGGDLAAAAIGDRARAPVTTVRDYATPPWLGAGALALVASYSGETEETLACFEAAGLAGATRVALTTGGTLAERARAEEVPVIGVPSGMQPRAAVAYMTVAALECAALCGAAPSLRGEIEGAAGLLGELAAEWDPDGPADSEAKALAMSLAGALPVVHGAGLTRAPAQRWKTQLNENGKLAAFWSELSEADHNEVCGWEGGRALAPLAAVMLDDPAGPDVLRRRIELTAESIADAGAPVERVSARGETPVERVLSLVLLGDLVSAYLAVLAGVDPTPVPAIEGFKARLA